MGDIKSPFSRREFLTTLHAPFSSSADPTRITSTTCLAPFHFDDSHEEQCFDATRAPSDEVAPCGESCALICQPANNFYFLIYFVVFEVFVAFKHIRIVW